MKHSARFLTPIILALLGLAIAGLGAAQAQAPISAEVDRTELTTDETLALTVTLDTASLLGAPQPTLPPLDGLRIVGSSSSSQISIINGAITSQAVYVYRLQPYQTGDLAIGPISVVLDGQTYSTQPITVHVSQGNGAPSTSSPAAPAAQPPAAAPGELNGQDFFVEAEVDNATPYVGQQVVYTFRFYHAVNLWDQPQYQAPSFQGFWNGQQADQQDYQVQAAGRLYRVAEIRTILFPSVVGPLTIEPARLTVPGGFFSTGTTLQSRPIELDVRPLPPDAPPGFNGAVGQFTITDTLDSPQGKVNEPLTWEVTLSGRGNLTAAPDPAWPVLPGWRSSESQATLDTQVVDGQMTGRRVYERLLVPATSGDFGLPALEYTYFDPELEQYQTVRTEPLSVSIAAGDAGVQAAPQPRAEGGQGKVEQLATDIRHLKPVPEELGQVSQPLTASALYWAAWAFPLFGAAGYLVWQRRQRYWENNLGLVRSSQARKKARQALARARRQGHDAYSAAGQILNIYLADKLDRPVAGLTHQALSELLAERGVSSDLSERVEVLLTSADLGRYAPGADSPDHAANLLQETGLLIDALERVL